MSNIKELKLNPSLPAVLVVSHGPLCHAIVESAKFVIGEVENVLSLSLTEDMDSEAFEKELSEMLNVLPDGSVVLVDMFAGTPFNKLVNCSLVNGKRYPALCGVNMPMLMDAVAFRSSQSGDELVKAIRESALASIIDVGEFLESV